MVKLSIQRLHLIPIFVGIISFALFSPLKAQDPPIVKISYLENLMQRKSDTTFIINFWATWCRPCVKELPYFEKLHKNTQDQKVKVILVSLDFASEYQARLIPFLKKRKLDSYVVLLDEMKYNDWLPRIDSEWDGAIPATLVLNTGKSYSRFYRQDFESLDELKTIVQPLINLE